MTYTYDDDNDGDDDDDDGDDDDDDDDDDNEDEDEDEDDEDDDDDDDDDDDEDEDDDDDDDDDDDGDDDNDDDHDDDNDDNDDDDEHEWTYTKKLHISQETTIYINDNCQTVQKIPRTSPCMCLRKPHEAPPKRSIDTVCTLWPRAGFPGKSWKISWFPHVSNNIYDGFPGKSAGFPMFPQCHGRSPGVLDLPLLLRQVSGLFQDALRCDALLLQMLPLPSGPGNDGRARTVGVDGDEK